MMAARFGLRGMARASRAAFAVPAPAALPMAAAVSRAGQAGAFAARRFASSSSSGTGTGFSYNALLASHPILTKSVTSMLVVGGGDWICQKFIEKRDQILWRRVATMGTIGLTLAGPLLHFWFGFVFRTFPGTGLAVTVKKVLMDQLVFAPIFNPLFVGYMFLLEGRPGDIVDFMKNDWLTVTTNNWKLWGPANAFNFTFVPAPFQVLFANFTGVVWNCYLSWKGHQEAHHDDDHHHSDGQEALVVADDAVALAAVAETSPGASDAE